MDERGFAVDRQVCFIGDSYVAGAGDPAMVGWAGRIAAAAVTDDLPPTYYNLGVRGQTGPQIAARVGVEVPPRLEPADDPRLVVSFGANDTVESDGRRRAAFAESVAALERIRSAIDAPVFVVGPPAVDDEAQNGRLEQLDAALEATAARLGTPYLALHATTRASSQWRREIAATDGYHPGAAGYKLLTEMATWPILHWFRVPREGTGPLAQLDETGS